MEELRVLIETTRPINGELRSAWFDLPIDEAELEETLGIEADSEDYHILEKELPFADEVGEDTPIERLNELALMYQNMPVELRKSYSSFSEYYSDFDEFYNYRNSIIHYAGCDTMIDVARHELADNPAFASLSEDCVRYFDYEAYAQSLEENRRFVKTEYGIFEIPW